jgi:hypothetical protein
VTRSLPIMYDWVLVSDLAPCGMMLASRWIAGDDATWLRVTLLLVRSLGHYVPLAETLSRCDSTIGSNFATQRSLDWVRANDGHYPIGLGDLVVS